MTTKQKVLDMLSTYEGEIDWKTSYITKHEKHLRIAAPKGFKWCYSGAPCFVISERSGNASDFWEEVVYMISFGIIKQEG